MQLPGRRERLLAGIEERLRREEPALAARFEIFTRLARDDGPPPQELRGG